MGRIPFPTRVAVLACGTRSAPAQRHAVQQRNFRIQSKDSDHNSCARKLQTDSDSVQFRVNASAPTGQTDDGRPYLMTRVMVKVPFDCCFQKHSSCTNRACVSDWTRHQGHTSDALLISSQTKTRMHLLILTYSSQHSKPECLLRMQRIA